MESTRQKKFAREMQRELSQLLQRGIDGLNGTLITVSHVSATADLQHIRVYITVMPETQLKPVLAVLKEENIKVRQMLATRIRKQVRVMPTLEFMYDDTLQTAARIDELFDQIRRADAERNPSDNPSE